MEPQTDTTTMQPESLSQGYCVELCVNADGTFAVSGPTPHEPEAPAGESETTPGESETTPGESLPTIGQALKAVLKIVQDNPIGASEQQSFEAGYASGPHRA